MLPEELYIRHWVRLGDNIQVHGTAQQGNVALDQWDAYRTGWDQGEFDPVWIRQLTNNCDDK